MINEQAMRELTDAYLDILELKRTVPETEVELHDNLDKQLSRTQMKLQLLKLVEETARKFEEQLANAGH